MILPMEDVVQDDWLACVLFGKHCAGILCLFVVESQSALVSKVEGLALVHPPGGLRNSSFLDRNT
jgi:hypothetical protein